LDQAYPINSGYNIRIRILACILYPISISLNGDPKKSILEINLI
jgi:hypothetical protein